MQLWLSPVQTRNGNEATCVAQKKKFLFLLGRISKGTRSLFMGCHSKETGIISFQPMFNSLCMTLGVSSTLVDGQ